MPVGEPKAEEMSINKFLNAVAGLIHRLANAIVEFIIRFRGDGFADFIGLTKLRFQGDAVVFDHGIVGFQNGARKVDLNDAGLNVKNLNTFWGQKGSVFLICALVSLKPE